MKEKIIVKNIFSRLPGVCGGAEADVRGGEDVGGAGVLRHGRQPRHRPRLQVDLQHHGQHRQYSGQ